jgi:hypothetical protein
VGSPKEGAKQTDAEHIQQAITVHSFMVFVFMVGACLQCIVVDAGARVNAGAMFLFTLSRDAH